MTTDPGPGTNGFPLPPSSTPPPGLPAYGPPSYGQPPHGVAPYQQAPYQQAQYQHGVPGRYHQPGMLAAAADRERTMDVLKAAFMEGRLTKAEFDERSGRVLSARTYGDLNGLVADLPSGPGGPAVLPYQQGYYYAPPVPKTNGYAIGSLAAGILAWLPFGALSAVILGHVARGQIRRTGERGDGMAVAGLVLGYLFLSMYLFIFLVMASGG